MRVLTSFQKVRGRMLRTKEVCRGGWQEPGAIGTYVLHITVAATYLGILGVILVICYSPHASLQGPLVEAETLDYPHGIPVGI